MKPRLFVINKAYWAVDKAVLVVVGWRLGQPYERGMGREGGAGWI